MITLKTFIVKRFSLPCDKLRLLGDKRSESVWRDFGQSHAVSLEISHTADKFDGVVVISEFDDGLKNRVGAEVPKSDRQSFFVRFALHIQMRIAVRIRGRIFF